MSTLFCYVTLVSSCAILVNTPVTCLIGDRILSAHDHATWETKVTDVDMRDPLWLLLLAGQHVIVSICSHMRPLTKLLTAALGDGDAALFGNVEHLLQA